MNTPSDSDQLPFEDRVKLFLARVFGGMHHIENFKCTPRFASCTHQGGMATFDFEQLTRIVLGAHEYCIRADVSASGRRQLTIMLHQRTREGDFFGRHPDLNEAIERWNACK